jgi:DNA polymerase III delta prime subunit
MYDVAIYNIHDLLKIKVVGSTTETGRIIDSTLSTFKYRTSEYESVRADMTILLGNFPSDNWHATGSTVGDRILYDEHSKTATVFKKAINSSTNNGDVEYIIAGDVSASDSEVLVYVPNLPKRATRIKTALSSISRLHLTRALLAIMGDKDLLNWNIEEETAKLRLAILEPFLYYRLPLLDASLVHASVLEKDGDGMMFAGTGHVGKTSLALMLIRKGYSYLGDDLVIVNKDGTVLAYPEPIRFQEQHLQMVSESVKKSLNRENWLKRKIYSKMLEISPREFFRLRPRTPIKLISDDARTSTSCSLRKIILIRRKILHEPAIRRVDPESIYGMLAAELFWEFEAGHWRHNQYLLSPSVARGEDFLEKEQNHRKKVSSILQSASKNAECFLVELPLESGAMETFNFLNEWLPNHL